VGSLTEEELSEFTRVRNVASQMIQQLGSLELRKNKLIRDLENNELNAKQLLSQARERIGISEETPWQVRDDGAIFALSSTEEDKSEG
jgi:NRPS condensation-like uncharacterized protein